MFFFEGGGYYSFGTPSNSYPKRRRFKPIALDGLLGQDDGMHGWVKFTSTHTLILLCIVHFTTTQFAVILVIQEGGGGSQDGPRTLFMAWKCSGRSTGLHNVDLYNFFMKSLLISHEWLIWTPPWLPLLWIFFELLTIRSSFVLGQKRLKN